VPQAQAINDAQNTPPGATGPRCNEIKLADHSGGSVRTGFQATGDAL
jgi:hypothetical protein